ncbi:hypothetical protein J2887_09970 [Marinobacter sp. CA1]|nr:hypothetical protein J2887_09970 [Marinobacter sp. CA1]
MEQAGAQLMNWFSVGCELHRDWRNDIEGFGGILANHLRHYVNLMQSYMAQKGLIETALPSIPIGIVGMVFWHLRV